MDKTNSDAYGDTHLWQVWHGLKPFTFFRQRFTRFASEFGLEALPALETVKGFTGVEKVDLKTPVMKHHQKCASGNEKILYYLTERFRLPASFADLVYLSQIQQAECIRIAVEHWRRNRPRCSGALYWQLNDCWPGTSWSSVDYEGRWKALQYAARRFFAPVALSIEEYATRVRVFVANDHPRPERLTWRWSLETLVGEMIESGSEQVTASPISATCLREFDFQRAVKQYGAARLVFIAGLYDYERCVSSQTMFFAKEKYMAFPNPELHWDMTQLDDQLVIELKANGFARYVELQFQGADPIFSDNFFDIPAGQSMQIRCPLPNGWTVEQAKRALRVRSLADVVPVEAKILNEAKQILYGLKPANLFARVLYDFID